MQKRWNSRLVVFEPTQLPWEFPIRVGPLTTRGEVSPIPPHSHDCFEIGYCYEGAGLFTIGRRIITFRAGDAVAIRPLVLHQMVSMPEVQTKWRFCNLNPPRLLTGILSADDATFLHEPTNEESFNNIFTPARYPEVCQNIMKIVEELADPAPDSPSLVRGLVWNLLIHLRRAQSAGVTRQETASAQRKLVQVRAAIELIATDYSRELPVAALAELCHLGEAQFRVVFHEATGLAPLDYLTSFRMKVAAALL